MENKEIPAFLRAKEINEDNMHEIIFSKGDDGFSPSDFEELLLHCATIGASDIHFQTNYPVKAEIYGKYFPVTRRIISFSEMSILINLIFGEGNISAANSNIPLDGGYVSRIQRKDESKKVGYGAAHVIKIDETRFRINSTLEEQGGDICHQVTLRIIPSELPKIEHMGLEESLKLSMLKNVYGLYFVNGSTGSGKTTNLASFVNHYIEEDAHLKIGISEHPIEFDYSVATKGKKHIIVSQSQVPQNIISFEKATSNNLRRALDIAIIGEASTAVTVKETVALATKGHKVFTTLHANDFSSSIKTALSFFPEEHQGAILNDLINYTQVILCQRLIKGTKKRVALREWVIFTPQVRQMLRAGGLSKISYVSKQVLDKYGHSFEQDANELFEKGLITEETYNELQEEFAMLRESEEEEMFNEMREVKIMQTIENLLESNRAILEQQMTLTQVTNFLAREIKALKLTKGELNAE